MINHPVCGNAAIKLRFFSYDESSLMAKSIRYPVVVHEALLQVKGPILDGKSFLL